jgi:hypothetical protein
MMTQDFFTEVHLFAGKLVLIMAIYSLGGSRANWHHTPNPQPGAAQPTQDGDFRDLPRRRLKNLSQSPQSEPETITNLRSTILVAPSRLGGSNHQK